MLCPQCKCYSDEGLVPICNKCQPNFTDNHGRTVAHRLARNKKIIPEQWNHDPTLADQNGKTVAMKYAEKGIVPPLKWQHNKNIIAKDGNTVAMYLAFMNVAVPEYWIHGDHIINQYGESLSSLNEGSTTELKQTRSPIEITITME